MHVEARPICPMCGGPLFARPHGEMNCVMHGAFFGHDLLESAFGIGSAAYAQMLAEKGAQVPRKCPLDRYALSEVHTPSGRVHADGCARCGSLWVSWDTIDEVIRTTPAPAAATTQAEARSLMGFAAALL